MMNNLYDQISKRKSVRVYNDKVLTDEVKELINQAIGELILYNGEPSTLRFEITSYDDFISDKKLNFIGDILYGKYYVQMGLHAKMLERQEDFLTSFGFNTKSFDENIYSASLSLPLSSNVGSFNLSFYPKIQYSFHDTSDFVLKNSKGLFGLDEDVNFVSLDTSFSFEAMQIKALQNIYPSLGLSLNAKHQKSLKDEVKAERIGLDGKVFLPSFFKNHSIRIGASWQKEIENDGFKFADKFLYSRGYKKVPNDEAFKASLDYALPLVYPDWGFGGATYFKRVRANLFYDLSKLKRDELYFEQKSYGAELFFDNTFLNTLPISFGFRESILQDEDILNKDEHKFEFIFNFQF